MLHVYFFITFVCMKKSIDDTKYLENLVSEGEHQQQDFKYKVMDAAKLARSVSAFANTDGGRLLIGVRDDGHLSGVRSEEEIFMMHAAAWKYCRPESAIRFETMHAGGKTIVVATIPPCAKKPVFALDEQGKRHAYIRRKDENIVASPVHLEIWRQEQSRNGTFTTIADDEHRLMEALEEMPHISLNRLVRLSKVNRRKTISILAKLCRFGLVEMEYTDHQFLFSSK